MPNFLMSLGFGEEPIGQTDISPKQGWGFIDSLKSMNKVGHLASLLHADLLAIKLH